MLSKISLLVLLVTVQACGHTQQTYQVDTKKSKLLWGKTVGGHSGYILLSSGILTYSPKGAPVGGTFVMDMNNVHATDSPVPKDNERVNRDLRTLDFLDIENFPTATIVVKQINQIGNTTNYNVAGDLTIKGITSPIVFTASIKQRDATVTISGDVELHRFTWKIHAPKTKTPSLDLLTGITQAVADAMTISLDLVLTKQ